MKKINRSKMSPEKLLPIIEEQRKLLMEALFMMGDTARMSPVVIVKRATEKLGIEEGKAAEKANPS